MMNSTHVTHVAPGKSKSGFGRNSSTTTPTRRRHRLDIKASFYSHSTRLSIRITRPHVSGEVSAVLYEQPTHVITTAQPNHFTR